MTPPKSLKKRTKTIDNKLNKYCINNSKKNMVHTHTKSLYNQDTQLLTYFIKDINNNENINIIDNDKNEKKLNINKNDNPNNINNYYYYITKFKFIKKDKNINKITKYKKSIKSDLINHKK